MSSEEDFFKWSADYSVNVAAIDEQHQELIAILNRLFIAVSKLEGDQAISGTLDSLTSYTEKHFALEESLMQQANYPDLDAHKAEHQRLLAQLDQFCKKQMLEEKHLHFEMLKFLKAWLKDHILRVDRKYYPSMQRAGISS
jgi:hemerythrin-like metal-binding protein